MEHAMLLPNFCRNFIKTVKKILNFLLGQSFNLTKCVVLKSENYGVPGITKCLENLEAMT